MVAGVHVSTTFTSLQRYWFGLVSCMAQLVEYRMHALLCGVLSVEELPTLVSDDNNNNDIDSHSTAIGNFI